MVPTLALGIPGSGSTALILAALIMHGFRPGPYLISETPEFVYAIFGAMLIANLGFLFIGLIGGILVFKSTTSETKKEIFFGIGFGLIAISLYFIFYITGTI